MAIPEELKGRKGDMLAARVAVPIFAAIIYGLYNFVLLGTSQDHYLYTSSPLWAAWRAWSGFSRTTCLSCRHR